MRDIDRIMIAIDAAEDAGKEISDRIARIIASLYHTGQNTLAYSFASTGAIPDPPDRLWHTMFASYNTMTREERRIADFFGTYLLNAGPRGPVNGWSNLSW